MVNKLDLKLGCLGLNLESIMYLLDDHRKVP